MKRILAFADTHELARAAGWIGAALLVAFGIATADKAMRTREAEASRNSAGTYSLPAGNPITGGTISKTWANNTLADIGVELTGSLSRNGMGGMLAPLQLASGTVTAPALSFTSETGTGFYRIGASDLGVAISGVKKLELTSALFTVTPVVLAADGSGAAPEYAFTADATSGLYRGTTGPRMAMGGVERQRWTSTGTEVSGGLIADGSLTIGASGTAISGSFRGTTTWDPISLGAGNVDSTTITVTGAVAGADCNVTPPSLISTPYAVVPVCWVTTNTCNIQIFSAVGTNNLPSGTWACRVWNP
jgi:hypothetical protein